ncbi:MAG: ABC transporter ATP-binding protein [Pseudomonadota bacterium]
MIDALRKILDLLDARERRRFWLLMVLLIVMGVVNTAGVASIMPFLAVLSDPSVVERNAWLARAYSLSGAAEPFDFLIWLGIGTTLAYIAGLAFKAGVTWALMRFSQLRLYTLSKRVFDGYLARPYPWFLNRHSANLSRNVLSEVGLVVGRVLTPLLGALSNGAVVIFLLGLLIIVDPLITLFVAALLGGGYALVFLYVRRKMTELGQIRVLADSERYKITQESLAGIKEVKVMGLEASFSSRFDGPALRVAEISALNGALNQIPRYLLEALAFGGMMVVVLVLAYLRRGDLATILPIVGVYALAGSRLAPALQEVYRALTDVRFGKPALDGLYSDLTSAPNLPMKSMCFEPIHVKTRLQLSNARFAYPGAARHALDGLDIEIAANSTVGLVGGTGAGKTTVVDVIMGLLELQSGEILVDDRSIRTDAERRAWRQSIGYVPQHIFLTDGSIASNIAFGMKDDEVDLASVERAARMAQLHDFVMEELPDGYATHVGDRGVRLSGGQRQRIGIARALYHDPDVLVLDEATSALDNVTERAVMEAVQALDGKKTVVIIAHRLTTVTACDQIFLLEGGRVSASGKYAELLESNMEFRNMVLGEAA